MKKILLLLLLLMSTVVFSETLENVTYRNEVTQQYSGKTEE